MAAVMAGSASIGNRAMVMPAAVSATAKPGSSSCMPVTRPATSRAIGPTVSKLGESGQTPSREIRPHVVLRPAVPQQAEGMRTEPPVSLP